MLVSMHLCVWVCVCVCVCGGVVGVCVATVYVCVLCKVIIQGGGGGGQYNGTVLLHLIDHRHPHNEVVMELPIAASYI